jgi:sulfide:quinone oxidoreductase
MAELARAGFKTVINNRPDGESEDQPSSAELAAAAEAAGLEYAHQPVVGNNITDVDIEGFDAIVSLAEQPVLAFCRTGTRCTTLWALTQADELDNASILSTAEQAGYDLSQLAGRLDQRRGQ